MLISIELNELNFEEVQRYSKDGKLPNFTKLFQQHGYVLTSSETQHDHLEPWIQWVTVHTGKSFAEHGIFRLGDFKKSPLDQIWEVLERRGLKVGAISPMNAENRLKSPAYFVPDPWMKTPVTGSWLLKKFYGAISQAVNDNATSRISLSSIFYLAAGAIRFARFSNYMRYLTLVAGAKRKKWNQALFLDLLLSDTFISLNKSTAASYATLFLNAGAHIQHHYMFSSRYYAGSSRNPDWYVPRDLDPVHDVYEAYDHILGNILKKFPTSRIQLITGLHQTAYPKTTYYWRLKNHETWLKSIGIEFASAEPRMSRDFLVKCDNPVQAEKASERLKSIRSKDGDVLFNVDKRGDDIFVELIYDKDIQSNFEYTIGEEKFHDFSENVAFVAIKNGEHSEQGYFLDSEMPEKIRKAGTIPLTSIFDIVRLSFD